MRFYVGCHHPHHAQHFPFACISLNALRRRKSAFPVNGWLLDSAAYSEVTTHGEHRTSVADYAKAVLRWAECGELHAAAAQDYMCEPHVLNRTGLTVAEHQRLTIDRYDALLERIAGRVPVLPVLQGYRPKDYAAHLDQYGDRLHPDAWVGVGSVCKRNAHPTSVLAVLEAIQSQRPDLRLHGFGVKRTALQLPAVRERLWSADSMAWSFAARYEGRDGNDWREAQRFAAEIEQENPWTQLALW